MRKRLTTVRARGLGAELRELRSKSGLSTRAVAERLGWSTSTLNRIENGKRAATSEEVAALLVVYGVTGAERDRLLNLAKDTDQPGWWEIPSPGLPPQLTALIGFESQATRIVSVDMLLVPGLLQTPEYTRALMTSGGVPSYEVEARVAMRMGRQTILSRPEPPELLAIIDEAALRRPLGSRTLMAEQLRHILKTASRRNVTVQVIPFAHGGHPGVNGSFMVLEFAKARTIVHMEHTRSSLFVDDPEDVDPYLQAVDTLREVALDPAASAEFIASVAAEYER